MTSSGRWDRTHLRTTIHNSMIQCLPLLVWYTLCVEVIITPHIYINTVRMNSKACWNIKSCKYHIFTLQLGMRYVQFYWEPRKISDVVSTVVFHCWLYVSVPWSAIPGSVLGMIWPHQHYMMDEQLDQTEYPVTILGHLATISTK